MHNTTKLILLISLLAFGCWGDETRDSTNTNPENRNSGTGALALSVSSVSSKSTIVPDTDMTVSYYDITGTGPGAAGFSMNGIAGNNVTVTDMACGAWSVGVIAKNSSGTAILSGACSINIIPGITTNSLVTVRPIDGTGTFIISISWPQGSVGFPTVSADLTPLGGESSALPLSLDLDGLSASYSNSDLDDGYYTLSLKLMDNGTVVWGTMQAVRIITGTITLVNNSLTAQDIQGGSVTLQIIQDMQNPVTIALEGVKSAILQDTNMTITSQTSEPVDSYQWYMDGDPLSGQTGPSITTSYYLPVGRHRLDLVVIKGQTMASEGFNFKVEPFIPVAKTPGGSNTDEASSIYNTNDGGYIVAGRSNSTDIPGSINHGNFDFYIVKISSTGETEWQKMYGGSGADEAASIQQTSDSGYIITGKSSSTDIPGLTNHGNQDYYVIKLNSSGDVEWQNMFGGGNVDNATSIQQSIDGGYIITGHAITAYISAVTPHGGMDIYTIKLDSLGNLEWQKAYGGNGYEYCYSIQQSADGGYVIGGISSSTDIPGTINHGGWDYYAVRIDAEGNILWQNLYGGSGSDEGSSIRQTAEGGYIMAGRSTSSDIPGLVNHGNYDSYIIMTDSDGNILWQNMYGGNGREETGSIWQTLDGGYIIAGFTGSTNLPARNYGSYDFYFIKLTNSGNLEWQKTYGGSNWDCAHSIVQTAGGAYAAAGYTYSSNIPGVTNHGGQDYLILIFNIDL